MLLERGQRGLLVGQTGSGKTQNALFQLRNSRVWPITIFDTKIEDSFPSLPDAGDSFKLVESLKEYQEASRLKREERPDYMLVRPSMEELTDFDALNEYTRLAFDKFGSGLFYFDEIYNWHNKGQAGNGLIGLLTRGRSKGKTVLMATQRPMWISRFCLTEAQKFYIHWLGDKRDKKALSEVIPEYDRIEDPPLHHFYFYSTATPGKKPQLFKPVPLTEPNEDRIKSMRWL